MSANVLVVGGDERLRHALEFLISGARVTVAHAPSDTEGLGVDVVVVTGAHALADVNEIRVHPTLHHTPVVLVAPGRNLEDRDWPAIGVWPVTESGFGLLDELTDAVMRLLARCHHPSMHRPVAAARVQEAS